MRLERISLFLLLFGLSFGLVLGQGDKAVVVGTVSDATGGIIPGAEVTLTRIATNEVLTALTGSTGDYAFRALPPGVYNLRASLPGFKTDERTGMKLDVGQLYRIDIVLSVGEVSEVVSVVSTAPILETEEPELNQVLTSEVAVNLPLNTRDVLIMGTLTPGISPSRNSQGGGMGYTVKGMRQSDNLVTLDGSMVSETNGGIVMRGNPDAIQEFEIKTGLYGAQYGIKPGGHFSMITKSGTNELHGAAFWFHRNDNLDARNFFSGVPPERKRNQYGASAGGPIILPGLFDGRDKAWWFFSYSNETIRGERTFTGTVPNAAERSGMFAETIMDPSTGQPFPNNTIPSGRFDPVTQKMIALYPTPNADISRGFNLVNATSSPNDIEEYIVKMDFRTGPDSRWSGRFYWYDTPITRVGPIPLFTRIDPHQSFAQNITNTRNFGANVVNEAGLHFYRRPYFPGQPSNSDPNFSNNLGIAGWPIKDPDFEGVPRIQVTGLAALGDSGNKGGVPEGNWEVKDNLSFTKGSHYIKTGYHYRYQYLGFYFRTRSIFGYTNDRYTGNAFGNMLLGDLTSATLGDENRLNTGQAGHHFYFQDNWKVSPKLTLNLGVRYELRLGWNDKRGFLSNLRYDCALAALPANPAPGCYNPAVTISDPVFPATGRYEADKSLWDFSKNAVMPRLGLAYRLTDDTVIRAGGGIYGNEPPGGMVYGALAGSRSGRANASRREFTSSPLVPDLPQQNPFTAFTPGAGLNNVGSFEHDMPQWYVPNWGLSLQHRIGENTMVEVGYQGSRSVHEYLIREVNDAEPLVPGSGDTRDRQERRPFPFFQSYSYLHGGGDQDYHGLEMKVEKRPGADGVTALVAYTWSKSIDVIGGRLGVAGDPREISRHRTNRENRGLGEANIPGRFAGLFGYEIPIGDGHRYGSDNALGKVLGGWSIFTILTMQKGSFFTPVLGSDIYDVGTNRTQRPDVSGNPNISAGSRSPERWFDGSVYSLPTGGRYGNAGRGTIEGPGLQNLDLSLLRKFPIMEGLGMEFRFEAFNILNHTNFRIPRNNFQSAGTFGSISSSHPARELQFGLKFYW